MTPHRFMVLVAALTAATLQAADDPLPSWNDGPPKASILKFVAEVTKQGGAGYVAPAERIAVFDNDGTLWPELLFVCASHGRPTRVGL